jgi:hypothetical protein
MKSMALKCLNARGSLGRKLVYLNTIIMEELTDMLIHFNQIRKAID